MFLILGASNGVTKMCQIKDCAICNAGQEFLKEEENQNKKDLDKVPPVCNGTKVTSDKQKYSVQNLPVCTKANSDQEEYSAQNPKVNSPGSPPGNLPGNLPGNIPGNIPGNLPGNLSLCTKLTSGQPHFSKSLARKDGITPLIMAAAMNHDLCVDLLLSAGVDPNEESKVGCLNLFFGSAWPRGPASINTICFVWSFI